MRISAVPITVMLLFASAAATFSQSPMMMESTGIYVNVAGGLAILPGTDETPHSRNFPKNPKDDNDADWSFDLGFGVDAAIGYDFGSFRADLEFTYLTSKFVFDVDPEAGRGANEEADDTLSVMAGMANAWYDLDTGSAWTPYIGIGVGAALLSAQLATGQDAADQYFDGSGIGFAYQAGVGVAFEVLSGFSLTAGYQFFGTLDTEVTDDNATTDDDNDDHTVTPTLMAHGVQLGMRFLF